MPALRDAVMEALHGVNVYTGFEASAEAVLQGWAGAHPSLARLATTPGPKLIADVGVWKGMSTINMALALKRGGIDGCVIAIDTFLGSPEHWRGGNHAGLFRSQNGLPDLYDTFLSNVVKAGVENYIVPMPQTSQNAAIILSRFRARLHLVHIDAAHEYEEVIRDAEAYYGLLQPGGYLIGDDYDVGWPGVIKAAAEMSMKYSIPLSIDHPKWIVQKPF